MRAIILAGGFGTRLRSITGDQLPKCMAKVWGKPGHRPKPFLDMILKSLRSQEITDITVALHYKAEVVTQWYGDALKYKIEHEPLGTGGAIKNCLKKGEKDPILVLNGDTITGADYNEMRKIHRHQVTIAVDKNGASAGVYIIDPFIFKKFNKKILSFEKDVFPHVTFSRYETWCTDMGTPDGYEKMQKECV